MKKVLFVFTAVAFLFCSQSTFAQTTIVNYDFNSGSSYSGLTPTLATNITSTASGTETFTTYSGTASGSSAFVANSTAGQALAMSNSSGTNTRYWTFQLGGSELAYYKTYKLYLQAQRSSTGAQTVTIAYSTDGSSFTNFSTTISPGNGSFVEQIFDLSAITSIDSKSSVYFKIMASGASGTGTLRIDNFEISATSTSGSGGVQNLTQVLATGNDAGGLNAVNFGKIGIGTTSPSEKLHVVGNIKSTGTIIATGINITGSSSASAFDSLKITGLSGTGNRTVYVDPYGNLKYGNPYPLCVTWTCSGNTVYNLNTGNVGIGTNNPLEKLHVLGSARFADGPNDYVIIGNPVAPVAKLNVVETTQNVPAIIAGDAFSKNIQLVPNLSGGAFAFNQIAQQGDAGIIYDGFNINPTAGLVIAPSSNSSTPSGFRITSSGSVGIGISNPGTNMHLEVQGSISIYDGNGNTSLFFGREQPTIQALTAANQYGEWGMQYWSASSNGSSLGGLNFWKPSGSDAGYGNYSGSSNAFLFLGDDGNIGMGVDPSKIDPQYKLSVNGAIRTTKVVVEIGWADYVFKKDYKLMPIEELEKFVSTNNHLPNIPSEKEIKEKGLDLGEVQAKQMAKIEELTLYIIDMNKKIQEQNQRIIELEKGTGKK